MRKITIFFSLIILCLVTIFFATPYWTLYKIKQAVDQNNAEALSSYIDYPSLRNNLKPQIQQQIQHKLGVDHPDNQIEAWGAVVSEKLSNQVVDLVVNPEAIQLLLQGKALKESIKLPSDQVISPIKKWFNPIENIFGVDSKPELSISPNAIVSEKEPQKTSEEKHISSDISGEKSLEKISMHYQDLNHFEVIIPSDDGQKTGFILKREGINWKIVNIKIKFF
ncbi:DUF2939 domain-containing protein [Acinetobacter gerneri]|jgi:hypothetical protein|uniref:DUF2939 domain-containing protein n=1 Tax=Acinetobacter gerneri TaxID=202952 RepID=UPI0023F1E65E|nr:DUF2939 domain-containing protein [Acinetobacter gerneri]MCH4245330.1 DUF2939 domain-containing protein [Acinetobacter gerneri]